MKTKTEKEKETVYELVNPSDAWTFEAPSDKIAFLVSLFVGRGQTPARRGEWMSPMYLGGLGGDPAVDYEKRFGEPLEGALERHKEEMIAGLRSFMIHRDRSPEPLTGRALEEWNDKHRSSLNDWGGYANEIADHLSKRGKTKAKA